MNVELMPAILVDTFEEFVDRIHICEDFAQTVQWDVMDGQFVDSVTFHDIASLQEVDTVLTLEAHLMVENPQEMLEPLAKAGVDRVIVHIEAVDDVPAFMKQLSKYDFEKGFAISPETPLDALDGVLDQVDEVLVMTVQPGESGQRFMPAALQKVKTLRKQHPSLTIAVDGGVNASTIVQAKTAGANRFAVNSAIFNAPDPAMAFEQLQALVA